MLKTFLNTEVAHQLALKIPKDERASTIQTHYIKGTQARAKEKCRKSMGMSTIFEWESSGWMMRGYSWRKMMLTYSWLMASVVFSKGHKADSNGLETGPNGWSELEGGVGKKKT